MYAKNIYNRMTKGSTECITQLHVQLHCMLALISHNGFTVQFHLIDVVQPLLQLQ